jgi:hypothetical protein
MIQFFRKQLEKKCNFCGKELSDPHATHCSDACLFKSVEKAKKFDPENVKTKNQ